MAADSRYTRLRESYLVGYAIPTRAIVCGPRDGCCERDCLVCAADPSDRSRRSAQPILRVVAFTWNFASELDSRMRRYLNRKSVFSITVVGIFCENRYAPVHA